MGNKQNNRVKNKIKDKIDIRQKIKEIEKSAEARNKRTKFLFFITTTLFVIMIVLIYISSGKKILIDENMDIAALDVKKYQAEILDLYNRENQLELFVNEMNRVQTLIGAYLISNSTLKEDSFANLVKTLRSEINNELWVNLNSEKSKYYNGKYIIDENGYLKFKFVNKNIEPNWVNDEKVSKYIILN